MSGGHFDYRNQTLGEDMEGQWADAEVNELFHDLFCGGDFSPRSYGGLALSLDFWLCGDTGEEDYREDVAAFKRKWFHRTPRNRVEFYQGKLREEYERLSRELGDA